jgi:2-polyprenyl-6-methoxyphenol hydroxylase-like FAD-dependent oxidoreductase
MTLATVPRYDGDGVADVGDRAVVVGGSLAGLLAARVLADGFERVTVVERDPLPDEPSTRPGVPQGSHVHVLQEAGRATLEDLFPGYGEDLLSAGGLLIDVVSDLVHYEEGGYLAEGPSRIPAYFATRPLLERIARRRVVAHGGIVLRAGCRCTDYLVDEDETTVEGVVVRDGDAAPEDVAADLVVDSTGRASRTPAWLSDHGYAAPDVDEVDIDVAYSTALVERPPDDRRAFFVAADAPRTRGAGVFPVEGDRWQATLFGYHGDHPPTDPDGFREFAASLPGPDLGGLLDRQPWVSAEIAHYPFPSNRRHRYEDLDRFPDGLVVVGDAIASFNPIYGQGMSVAALQALELHHALAAEGLADIGRRFFGRVEGTVDAPWSVAAGGDFEFPQTTGPKPQGTDIVNRYVARLIRKAHTDGELREALTRVFMMEDPPSALFRPGVAWRVLKPTVAAADSASRPPTKRGSRDTS